MGCLNILLRKYFYNDYTQKEKVTVLESNKASYEARKLYIPVCQKRETITNVVSKITLKKIVVKYA